MSTIQLNNLNKPPVSSAPKVADDTLSIKLRTQPILEMALAYCLDDAKDYQSISLTCKKWHSIASDKNFLERILKSFSPVFAQESNNAVSPLLQYKLYSSFYISSAFRNAPTEGAPNSSATHIRIYYKDLLRFADLLGKEKGHEKMENFSIAFISSSLEILKKEDRAALPKLPQRFPIAEYVRACVARKEAIRLHISQMASKAQKKDLKPIILKTNTPLAYFAELSLKLPLNPTNDFSKLHEKIYYLAYELTGQDGARSFHDREDCVSTGAQKAEAVYQFISGRISNFHNPINFLKFNRSLDAKKVHYEMYKILGSPEGKNVGHDAFFGLNGKTATDEQRWQAIKAAFPDISPEHISPKEDISDL